MNEWADAMDAAPAFFASTYSQARDLFRNACAGRGLAVNEYPHPLRGPGGVSLAVDVALLGPADAANLLIVNSGTHGIEGLAGSGCQVACLKLYDRADLPEDTAVLFVHVLNPWGCAWTRRQTEDNVDLNRNFLDFDQALPVNELYEAVHGIVVNSDHVVRAAQDPLLTRFRQENGEPALASALFSGQYQHNDGVGYGGNKASWSNQTLRSILQVHAAAARRVVFLDIHTGLGPFGYGSLMSTGLADSTTLHRARAYFGPGVSPIGGGTFSSYKAHGSMLEWLCNHFDGEMTGIALEFGTSTLESLLELQIDDCRLRNFHDSWASLSRAIRSDLIEFFFPATTDWVQSLVLRSLQVTHLALRGFQNASAGGSGPVSGV